MANLKKDLINTFPIKAKILLVDDDRAFRNEFKACFKEYDFIEASSGQDALNILKKPHEIDLVILDVNMPGMDGIEVLVKMKRLVSDMNIIILTAYGSKDLVLEALRERADNYIEKPIDIEKTRKIIEKILETKIKLYVNGNSDIKAKIERVRVFLQRNCLKKTSLKDASLIASLSPKYLSRAFKQITGKGFAEYKLILKMNIAKNFLEKSSFNINQIADKTGYQNSESFTRQFKRCTGVSPAEYRNKNAT